MPIAPLSSLFVSFMGTPEFISHPRSIPGSADVGFGLSLSHTSSWLWLNQGSPARLLQLSQL